MTAPLSFFVTIARSSHTKSKAANNGNAEAPPNKSISVVSIKGESANRAVTSLAVARLTPASAKLSFKVGLSPWRVSVSVMLIAVEPFSGFVSYYCIGFFDSSITALGNGPRRVNIAGRISAEKLATHTRIAVRMRKPFLIFETVNRM